MALPDAVIASERELHGEKLLKKSVKLPDLFAVIYRLSL